MDNYSDKKIQITKGRPSLRFKEIMMDSDGLLTLVKLNILFLVTTLPPFMIFFTGGPAITALLYCTNQLVKSGSISNVRKTYFNIFKNNFRKTVIAGMAITVMNIIFIGGLLLYLTLASENLMYIPFASISLLAIIFIWAVTIHLFPAFAERNDSRSIKEMIIAASQTAVLRMKYTLTAVVVSLFIIIGIILMLPKTLPLLLVMMFSVPGLAAGFAHTDREFISDAV